MSGRHRRDRRPGRWGWATPLGCATLLGAATDPFAPHSAIVLGLLAVPAVVLRTRLRPAWRRMYRLLISGGLGLALLEIQLEYGTAVGNAHVSVLFVSAAGLASVLLAEAVRPTPTRPRPHLDRD